MLAEATRKVLDVVDTSIVSTMSAHSGIAFVNGYTKQDGWEVRGMDYAVSDIIIIEMQNTVMA